MVMVIVLTMLGMLSPEMQGEMFSTTLYVAVGYTIAQVIDNNVTSPLIFSNSVKSHPLEIFMVVLAGGMLFGITGMIVAIPMYTILKIIAKEFYPNNPVVKIFTKDL
jgi:predicted PurR-regulated permease PerM